MILDYKRKFKYFRFNFNFFVTKIKQNRLPNINHINESI